MGWLNLPCNQTASLWKYRGVELIAIQDKNKYASFITDVNGSDL